MSKVKHIYHHLNEIAPFDTAEEWDNVGLLIGDKEAEVKRCMVALDLTDEVIAEAELEKIQLIITHHPVIFDNIKKVDASQRCYQLIRKGIHVISAHTNLDKANGGINDVLSAKIGLSNVRSLYNVGDLGRIGVLDSSVWPDEFAKSVKESLGCQGIRYVSGAKPIVRVAVACGSGGSLIDEMIQLNVDAFVTADVKYNVMLKANHAGITLVDAGHYETENIICEELIRRFTPEFPDVEFTVPQLWKNPIKFI